MRSLALLILVPLAACASSTPPAATSPSDIGRSTTTVSAGGVYGAVDLTTLRDDRGAVLELAVAPEVAWAELAAAYEDLGIEVGTYDDRSRRLGNRALRARSIAGNPVSEYVRCGSDAFGRPLAQGTAVTLELISAVEPVEGGRSRVVTGLQGVARSRATNTPPVACTSTGRLEAMVGARVAERLAQR